MTDERKYADDEIREILDRAARPAEEGHPSVSNEGGLTLAQIQEVGREVGMDPNRIAEAARAVSKRPEAVPQRTLLGMPVSVGRIVDLPRNLTDREWDVLVGQLRETFRAKGRVAAHGSIREWTNGNLHVYLEPTATGYRLRMGTLKSSARPMVAVGAAGLVVGSSLFALFFLEQLGRAPLVIPTLMAVFGGTTMVTNLMRLAPWAREREAQMEAIADRVAGLLQQPSEEDGGG